MATPEEYAAAAKAFREKNWNNGGTTVTDTTENQNLAAVANQPGNTSGAKATPYITPQGTTDYHITGGPYVAPPTTVSAPASGISDAVTSTPSTGSGSSGGSGDSGAINAQNYINQLNDLRKNAAISALGKSHDAALSNLGNEKSAIQPKYYDQRNQVAAGAQQQARNFAEFMAQRGGSSSGANAQATLSNNMATQGNLGSLGRQEAQAYTDIERRTTDVNNAYESDVASATANAEADKMQALLQDYYTAQQRGDTLAQNQIQNAIAQSQLAMQQAGQTADYTGQFGGKQTLAAQQQAYNQDPNNPSNIGQGLQNIGQQQQNLLNQYKIDDYPAEQKANATKVQQDLATGKLTLEAAKYNFDQLKDPNSTINQANKIDLQLKQLDLKNAPEKARLELVQLQKQIAEIGKVHTQPQSAADQAADQVKLATANKQLEDIKKGIYPGDKSAQPPKVITAEEYQSNLKPQYDNHGKITNIQQIEDQIILSGMSDWEQYKSYKANGIPWDDPIPQKPS